MFALISARDARDILESEMPCAAGAALSSQGRRTIMSHFERHTRVTRNRVVIEALESRVHLSMDDRGRISIIVDNTLASSISVGLSQLDMDDVGDGWSVSLHTDAPRMDDEHYVWDNVNRIPITNDNFGDFKQQY